MMLGERNAIEDVATSRIFITTSSFALERSTRLIDYPTPPGWVGLLTLLANNVRAVPLDPIITALGLIKSSWLDFE
jgi:hypothetical protein